MKKEKFGLIIAVLLAPVLLAGIVAFCRHEAKDALASEGNSDVYEQQAVSGKTLKEKGYVFNQQFPEGFSRLMELGIWESDESAEEEPSEADNAVPADEEMIEDDEQWPVEEILTLEDLKSGKLLDSSEFCVGKDNSRYEDLDTTLKFDTKNFCFTSSDVIEKIESCGFPGFGKQLEQCAQLIRKRGVISYGEYYSIFCQGVEFVLCPTATTKSQTDVWLSVCLNASDYYVPEKYQEFIRNVTEDGEYFFYSSCIGGEIESLCFCKNNSLAATGYDEKSKDEENDNKRIIFLFKNNNLVDYYVTTSGNNELVLDDKDQKLLETFTKGLGKELSEKPEALMDGYMGYYRLYLTN